MLNKTETGWLLCCMQLPVVAQCSPVLSKFSPLLRQDGCCVACSCLLLPSVVRMLDKTENGWLLCCMQLPVVAQCCQNAQNRDRMIAVLHAVACCSPVLSECSIKLRQDGCCVACSCLLLPSVAQCCQNSHHY